MISLDSMAKLANQTIPHPLWKWELVDQDGDTSDIVREILEGYDEFKGQLAGFADKLRGQPMGELLPAIWAFVRKKIHYKLDPPGKQWIKSPAAAWHGKISDCKSMSIFTGSVLYNLGIPHGFRFVSFSEVPNWTHVYVIIPIGNKTIILDSVWNRFNQQKKYTLKKDFMPTDIYRVSGIGKAPKGQLDIGDPLNLTEGKLTLQIAKQRLQIKQGLARSIRGIGSTLDEKYEDQLEMLEEVEESIHNPEELEITIQQIEDGEFNTAAEISGIGSAASRRAKRKKRQEKRKKKKAAKKANKQKPANKKKGLRNFIKKIARGTKKALKTVIKVATAPGRLLMKGILEVTLPKAAPVFLYLFVNDPDLIAKLPPKARAKRAKAAKIAKFIVKGLGMKRAHFMGIVRNGILKQHGKKPEKVIAEAMQGKISGIGFVDPIAMINMVRKLFKAIKKLLGKKGARTPGFSDKDLPDLGSDFAGMSITNVKELSQEVKDQKADDPSDLADIDTSSPTGGRKTNSIC